MSDYRIVCVEKVSSGDHPHLTHVGTGTKVSAASERWTVAKVRDAIDAGDNFYTVGTDDEQANVEKYTCCGVETIRTDPDDTKTDNLDSLRICSWKQ